MVQNFGLRRIPRERSRNFRDRSLGVHLNPKILVKKIWSKNLVTNFGQKIWSKLLALTYFPRYPQGGCFETNKHKTPPFRNALSRLFEKIKHFQFFDLRTARPLPPEHLGTRTGCTDEPPPRPKNAKTTLKTS